MMCKKLIVITILFLHQGFSQEYNFDAFSDIFVYDSASVWAVTNSGNIWQSTDGGISWIINNTHIDTVWEIHFADPINGWLLSNRGVYKTTNGGQNWVINFEPDSIHFRDLMFISDSIGFAVGFIGESSRIYRTTDNGNEWITVLDSSYSGLFRLGYANKRLIWTVGHGRVIYKSNNLGDNWETIYQTPPYPGFYLFQAQLFDNFYGILGDGVDHIVVEGSLKYTSDGGMNWAAYGTNLNLTFGIGDFYFISINEGWVANLNRELFYTNNTGATWDTLQDYTSLSNSINKFSFLDNQNAWGLTYQDIVQTNDGWQSIVVRGTLSDISNINEMPTEFYLEQNYPNPFNPSTTIKYQIPERSFVTIKVYDVLGGEIATLVNYEKPIETHTIEFDASNLPSGIYFYQLQTPNFTQTKKMILLK